MSEEQKHWVEVQSRIGDLRANQALYDQSLAWIRAVAPYKYVFNFCWLGRPIIQFPQDIVAIQELIWRIRPTLVVETGVAHGGSLVLSASMLALLDYADARANNTVLNPRIPLRKVVGIDIDVRPHNRKAIAVHPMADRIEIIEGSSVSPHVIDAVGAIAAQHSTVMVLLDSDHTHEHVLRELQAYARMVTVGSYCVVFDTGIEDLPAGAFPGRAWDKGNNPKTAVWEFVRSHPEFEIDPDIQAKLLITGAPDGFLRRRA